VEHHLSDGEYDIMQGHSYGNMSLVMVAVQPLSPQCNGQLENLSNTSLLAILHEFQEFEPVC